MLLLLQPRIEYLLEELNPEDSMSKNRKTLDVFGHNILHTTHYTLSIHTIYPHYLSTLSIHTIYPHYLSTLSILIYLYLSLSIALSMYLSIYLSSYLAFFLSFFICLFLSNYLYLSTFIYLS